MYDQTFNDPQTAGAHCSHSKVNSAFSRLWNVARRMPISMMPEMYSQKWKCLCVADVRYGASMAALRAFFWPTTTRNFLARATAFCATRSCPSQGHRPAKSRLHYGGKRQCFDRRLSPGIRAPLCDRHHRRALPTSGLRRSRPFARRPVTPARLSHRRCRLHRRRRCALLFLHLPRSTCLVQR